MSLRPLSMHAHKGGGAIGFTLSWMLPKCIALLVLPVKLSYNSTNVKLNKPVLETIKLLFL